MKNIILFVSSFFIMGLFSGCSFKANYDNAYISRNINHNYAKVETQEMNIIKTNNILKRSPSSFNGGGSSLEVPVGDISSNILKEFYSQYFSKVETTNSLNTNAKYNTKIEFIDFQYAYGEFNDSSKILIKMRIIFYENGIEKLNKIYEKEENNKVFLVMTGFTRPIDKTYELFHKIILSVYEEDFKKDLLAVL